EVAGETDDGAGHRRGTPRDSYLGRRFGGAGETLAARLKVAPYFLWFAALLPTSGTAALRPRSGCGRHHGGRTSADDCARSRRRWDRGRKPAARVARRRSTMVL